MGSAMVVEIICLFSTSSCLLSTISIVLFLCSPSSMVCFSGVSNFLGETPVERPFLRGPVSKLLRGAMILEDLARLKECWCCCNFYIKVIEEFFLWTASLWRESFLWGASLLWGESFLWCTSWCTSILLILWISIVFTLVTGFLCIKQFWVFLVALNSNPRLEIYFLLVEFG